MIRNLIWFLALFSLLLFQAGVLLPFHIAPVNLILIIVVLSAILSDFNQGLIITLFGGLLLDFTSGSSDGLMSISLLLVFLLMHLILTEILTKEPNQFILAASVAVSTVIFYLAVLALTQLFVAINFSQPLSAKNLLTAELPYTLLWNLILGYPILKFYIFVQNLFSKFPSNEEPIRT